MKIKNLLILLITIGLVPPTYAQYIGGSGKGDHSAVYAGGRLNGPQTISQLIIRAQPPNLLEPTQAFTIQLSLVDVDGVPVFGANNAISLGIANNPDGGTLSGTTTVNAVNGEASFNGLSIDKIGFGYTLQASSGALSVVSTSFTIFTIGTGGSGKGDNSALYAGGRLNGPQTINQLVVTTQPSTAVEPAQPFATQLSLVDVDGVPVFGANNAITLGIANNPGASALSGTVTVNAVNGVAVFNGLSINNSGFGYTLQGSSGSLSVISAAMDVLTVGTGGIGKGDSTTTYAGGRLNGPQTISQLVFTTQPPSVLEPGQPFVTHLSLLDVDGVPVFGANNAITLNIANNPGAGTLNGTTTVNAVNGIGVFSGLSINNSGFGYTLQGSSGSLSVISAAMNVYTLGAGGIGKGDAVSEIVCYSNISAGAASSSPTLCINTVLIPITHTTAGASGIGVPTGLPAGTTASWTANMITISGTPTQSGTFNYTIPLTGGCSSNVNAVGTITVIPINSVGAASSSPTLCVNTSLTSITHTTTGSTGIGTPLGLPAGVTATWSSNTITISGTPTTSGTFNYSIPLTGGCGNVNATGMFTVTPASTAGPASSTPLVNINTSITPITHMTTGATGISPASGLPPGVIATWSSNTITISGTPTVSGVFNYSISLLSGCGTTAAMGTITVKSDIDGDGVDYALDGDDDNDGIIDDLECGICSNAAFMNGNFESPVLSPSTSSLVTLANTSGWLNTVESTLEIWSTGFNGVSSAVGNQFIKLNSGTVYQTFCLNGTGGKINWNVKHRGRSGIDVAVFQIGSNLGSISTVATMSDGNNDWGSYAGTYTIPNGQTSLVIAFSPISSTGGIDFGNFIDDIQITINQSCKDSDGDGVTDNLDLDSDNDGISDIEEAGFKQYSSNTSTMDLTSVATWTDSNTNGINDAIDSMISASAYNLFDTDGDGIPNYLDLDSDNDSFFDVDEAGLLNGDGDINGDGKGDGLDVDADGLLDFFDNSTVFGTTFRAYAQDTDANSIADYMQLDSNSDGINDIQTGLYASLDTNGDGRIDGLGDADNDGILDIFDTNDAAMGSPRDLSRKLYLDFDGRNDYAENVSLLGGLSNATLMAWIDLNSTFSTTGVIVGQDKFQLRVTNTKNLQAIVNGTTLTFGTALNTSQWYHVAASYGGGTLSLYLNGNLVASQAVTGSISSDTSKLTLGKNPLSASNYFKGKIDEVRVFNSALTASQIQRMVYQEIQNSSSQVRGTIVPKDIESLPFANLIRYYRMDTYKDDIIDDLTTSTVDIGSGMKIYNHKVIAVQEAPMPFATVRTGTFASAVDDPTKDIRGLDVMDSDFSIIQVKHNITETANSIDLGMFVDPGVTINMTNDTKLQNDWYLKLDGKIDLVGKSQLVQTAQSDLDVSSSGFVERDQQGQSNLYNYNYWSSPVSSINSGTINHGFTVAGVMKDGTTSIPQNITWTTGYDGSPTSPLTLSSYWIYKFQNSTNSYANWSPVGQNGTLLSGQGYTLKGSGASTLNQNYTFVGKPNNGLITSIVGAGNLNLCGNPYASALDANKFIDDNASSILGTLYFWEHYTTNSSHSTIQYQGGYGTYTKTGGTPPVAPSGISGLGSSSKVAKRFIPIGQGFFVTGSTSGGTITFNNSQRLFIKEDDIVNSFTLFKNVNRAITENVDPLMNNAQDNVEPQQFMKIRLGFTSTDNLHRQILLGFMNEFATSGYDNGYDGISIETLSNDMYFINGNDKLNISGEGFFNVNTIYPLGVKNATSGLVTFVVDDKENFDEGQDIFIYDNETNTYNSIKSQGYQVYLPSGTYDSRFSLRFSDDSSLGVVENGDVKGIHVTHSQVNNTIYIKNLQQNIVVKSVIMFNLLGQEITAWQTNNLDQTDIRLQIGNMSSGTYIIKVLTDGGLLSKKIIVK
jgi:hypothetical protein